MNVDRYTKTVLTVIAACLLWMSAGGPSLLTKVTAQSNAQEVVVAGWMDNSGVVKKLSPFGIQTVVVRDPTRPQP